MSTTLQTYDPIFIIQDPSFPMSVLVIVLIIITLIIIWFRTKH